MYTKHSVLFLSIFFFFLFFLSSFFLFTLAQYNMEVHYLLCSHRIRTIVYIVHYARTSTCIQTDTQRFRGLERRFSVPVYSSRVSYCPSRLCFLVSLLLLHPFRHNSTLLHTVLCAELTLSLSLSLLRSYSSILSAILFIYFFVF